MAQYKLHCFCQSGNSYKVALYLQCAGLDWEPVLVDYFNGETRDPKWRETVNEMGEAPVLDDGAMRLAQSGVILSYLAEKTGKFRSTGEAQRLEALRWMLFDNHKFTSYFATYRFMKSFMKQEPDPGVMAFLKGRFDGALAIVESHLGQSRFMAGMSPPSPTSRSPATCSTRPRRAAMTGPSPTRTWRHGSSACARCPAGRGRTS